MRAREPIQDDAKFGLALQVSEKCREFARDEANPTQRFDEPRRGNDLMAAPGALNQRQQVVAAVWRDENRVRGLPAWPLHN